MIMITEYDFNLASGANSWKRVDDIHPVNLYYGKDNQGRNAIEFSGQFVINRKIHSSVVIITNPPSLSLAISISRQPPVLILLETIGSPELSISQL